MFEIKSNPQLNKDSFSFNDKGKYPYFTRTIFNNGYTGYVDYLDEEHKIKGNCLAIGMIGMQFFYVDRDFYAGQFTKRAIPKGFNLNYKIAMYFISLMNKQQKVFQNVLVRDFEQTFNKTKIQLPTKKGKIDFKFMESFIAELEAQRIAELEAYLTLTGLKNTNLSLEEEQVISDLKNNKIDFDDFSYETIFEKIVQGRRLKKDDQLPGKIPFVMAGVTNTGVVGYISNPIARFPKNAITIDIFGNAFYRDYEFGAGDDTGVYWNEKNIYSKKEMLFLTATMGKSLKNKFSYGKKLRSSQSLKIKMKLPVLNGMPDYRTMELIVSAVQKLVIKDVVAYSDRKIKATKDVIKMTN